VRAYLSSLDKYYSDKFQRISKQKENYFNFFLDKDPDAWDALRDNYNNEGVSDIVRKVFEKIRYWSTIITLFNTMILYTRTPMWMAY
jgi:hypothetical protein